MSSSGLTLPLIAQLLVLGTCGGIMAGLLGVGGGMVLVPFLTAMLKSMGVPLDVAVKMGIATGMATIVFTSISSQLSHHRRGAVRWDFVRHIAPGILLGAILASLGVFTVLKGKWLALVFGVFVIFSATQMLLNRQPKASRTMPGPVGRAGVGTGIGFLSGLVGAGGGFISVPFMTWCNVPMHQAVGTSAALGLPIALFNSIGYSISGSGVADRPDYTLGYIWLPALLALASCSILTAPIGAKLAHSLDVKPLKRIFALLLYALAFYMLYQAWAAWALPLA